MDEDSNLKQSLLKGPSQSSRTQSDRDDGNNDSEDTFDTFETIAYNAPRGRGTTSSRYGLAPTTSGPLMPGAYAPSTSSSASGQSNRLGRSSTYCPSQAAALKREGDSGDEMVLAYKQKYAKMDMHKVSFMTRFRTTALQLDREPSARMDSSTVVKMDGEQSGELSPNKNAPPSVLSEMSQGAPQQMMQGAMGSAFVDVRKRASELKLKESRHSYFVFARLAFEVVITTIAVLAAIAVAIHDAHYEGFARLWGVPLLSWLVLLALLCPTIRFGDRAVDGVVKVLEMVATRLHLENVHYTLIGLSDVLKLVAVALLFEILVLFIMKEHEDTKEDDKTLWVIKRLSLCFVVFSFVELIKTLGCRLLSLRVNAESLFDLLKDTIKKEHILNKVMTRGRAATTRGSGMLTGGVTESERIEAIAKLRDIPEWSVEQYLDNLYELSLPVDEDVVAAFTDRITDLVAQFRNMREAQLDEHATCAAEFCWLTVAPAANICAERMYKEDLAVLLQNEEEAEFAFSLFDVDADGFVSEPEVHSRMKSMYRERRNLARTLKDNDDVIQTLEMLIGVIMHMFAIIPYLMIFDQDITHLLFSLSSVSVAGAFVFGNSLKTIYESVVFLFVVRPYQVGDAILYKEALHQVKNFGLLSTQFLRFDGCKIWVPNEQLMQCDIINVTNSRHLIDRLTFEVDVQAMRPQLCDDLARRVAEMQEREEPRRLFSNNFPPNSYILGVTNPLKYSVGLTYKLAFNGEKFAKVVEARTLINYIIGQWMIDHQLSHSTSVQPLYTFSPSSPTKSSMSTK